MLGEGHKVPEFSASACTFRFIQRCLGRCNVTHSRCKPTKAQCLPKRLIHIGDSCNARIHLVESESIRNDSLYVALSHCWGDYGLLTTTESTVCARKECIEWEELSKVFQDAILVARHFHISYIWIDSICIIQDSKDNWEIESSRMAQVYENSFFTVAATSSPNGSISFLNTPHQVSPRSHLELPWNYQNHNSIPVGIRRTSLAFSAGTIEGPLSKRAWAWQEQVLSKRVIQFTPQEVKWHCCEECCCECSLRPERGKKSIETHEMQLMYAQWHELVMDYSGRKLTVLSDRLPAISGVASIFQASVSSEYLAGLWKNHLCRDLLWYCDPKEPFQIPVTWEDGSSGDSISPPSWSWASIDGKVRYLFVGEVTEYITPIDAGCSLVGQNPFGAVKSGFITIRTRSFNAMLQNDTPSDRSKYKLTRFETSCFMKPDSQLQTNRILCSSLRMEPSVRRAPEASVRGSVADVPPHRECEPVNSNVTCILGCHMKLDDGTTSYQFLILGKSISTPGAYERIGWVSMCSEMARMWLKCSKMEVICLV